MLSMLIATGAFNNRRSLIGRPLCRRTLGANVRIDADNNRLAVNRDRRRLVAVSRRDDERFARARWHRRLHRQFENQKSVNNLRVQSVSPREKVTFSRHAVGR
jgi:hypothetical protein